MKEFFAMGGYAFYVWLSYGVFAVVLLWAAITPVLRRRTAIQRIQDRAERDRRRGNHDADT